MRKLPAIAIVISLLAAASSSYADDSKPTSGSPTTKKVAKKGGKKKKPAAPVAEETPAPATEPQPVPVTAAAPAPAPAPVPVATAPVAQTSTTSAKLDRDSLKDDIEPMPPISAAPIVGLATNGLGFGLGARAGYTLPMKLYVGGQFMYHFGTSPVPEVSVSSFYPSAEVGYEFHPVNHLMVRPYGGLGVMFTSVSVSNSILGDGAYSATGHSFLFYPGCTVTYTIPKSDVFVGGDARLLLATSYGGSYGGGVAAFGASFGIFATAGMRF